MKKIIRLFNGIDQCFLHGHRQMLNTLKIFLVATFSLVLLSSCASKYTQKTQEMLGENNPNLVVNTESRLDLSMLDQNRDWNNYRDVFIAPATVNFSERWLKDNKTKVSKRYIEMIKKDYSELLNKSIKKKISDSKKIQVADQITENALILEARIEDLVIYGPETISHSKSYVNNAGMGTFHANLKSPTGKILGAFKDREETTERGFLKPERTSRVFNYHDFRLLMEDWAKKMLRDIDT